MAEEKYHASGEDPRSAIKKQGFQGFLSSLFGWQRNADKKNPIKFVSVDPVSDKRIDQANVQDMLRSGKLSSKLEELFDSWLTDTSDSLREISNRARRVDALTYAKLNDPFIGRVCKLYADEATQLDIQDHIIGIESPDPRMTKEMYGLLNQWGITQQRVHAAIEQLATYGDSFWSNKVTELGVERIVPLKQLQISDRLEFNPVDAMERMKRMSGSASTLADRHSLIQTMLDDLGEVDDFSSMFDTKLFGFALQNDLVVPPWAVTHFRVNADASEFYPFGVSPILGTLAPFKLTASTITLQSIARVLSFPVTLYKVKTSDGADEGRQFATVNRVREEYDNVGVTPNGGNSEVYSVNTKIWMPEGLMDVEVKAAQIDIDFVGDIEMYQNRVAVASGVPKSYVDQEFGGYGVSALSLTEQYKPFGRAVYSLQAAFLEGLADLFRLHFAINGKFDFRTPFTLSLRYPAEEVSSDKNSTRAASLELAGSVLDVIRAAVGSSEDEGLPPDIVRDIISKYTFLDPVDIVKWTRDAKYSKDSASVSGGGGDMGDHEPDLGAALAADAESEGDGDYEDAVDLDSTEEATATKNRERRLHEARFRELSKRYEAAKQDIYFQTLQESAIGDFVRDKHHVHICLNQSSPSSLMLESFEKTRKGENVRLKETTITEVLQETKDNNLVD